ncbi:fibrobacter succinogenes major paralogous domain-containing protein [Echinicola sp. CAU 1574]|uniref:Fibrobacter succinogenes major paralogous domain-containing protein n=1 Tax=Echinicola arenosa TaxID=2774144 RepID=A0ABR9AL59_9BACT|nr:fibrobacter succinogenes major paralogous domain-containing protein [Echinicola arenosa]MBD8489487.1 fibrobacter succinogenes major paralogous domain-containing protein [Echinicola arenosa]
MKNSIYYLSLLFLLATSCVQENLEAPKMGMVSFSAISFTHFGGLSPNARMLEDSEWKHIFKESATLTITHKETGAEYSLQYNPNDFTDAYQIQLPYGEYTVFSEVTGGDFEAFLPFTISGEFTLAETSLDISLQGSTDYGLVTVKKEFVLSANLDGEHELEICDQGFTLYAYVKDGLTPTLTIYENFNGQALQKELDIAAYNHYHFYLKLTEVQGTVNLIELAIGPFEYHEEFFEIGGEEEITSVTDADGNEYKVVKIGEQYWMAEDLNTTKFCNGEDILTLRTEQIFENITEPNMSFAVQNRSTMLYYSEAANYDERNICPCNWHVSTDEDWRSLETYLGLPENQFESGLYTRGATQNIGGKLKAVEEWPFPDDNFNYVNTGATNEYGFTILPYGYVYPDDEFDGVTYYSTFEDEYEAAYIWTPIEGSHIEDNALYIREFRYSIDGIRRSRFNPTAASVRCVKD